MQTGATVQAQGSVAVQWLSQGSAQGGSGTGKSSCRKWRHELGGWSKSDSDSGHWQWCAQARQWLGRARLLEGALRRLGRGGDDVNEKPTPFPQVISLKRQPKGPFRYYSEFEPNLLHLQIEFPVFKY